MRRFFQLFILAAAFASVSPSMAQAEPTSEAENAELAGIPSTSFPKPRGKDTADAVNMVVMGSKEQLIEAFSRADWKVATQLGFKSSLREVIATLKGSSYPTGPVSTQFLFHKPQDIAFELELGNATQRHHVRFWEMPQHPGVWVGAASEDIGLLIKPHKGVISHRVNSMIDAERDLIEKTLASTCAHAIRKTRLKDVQLSRLTAQGVRIFTDGDLSLLSVKDCVKPGGVGEDPLAPPAEALSDQAEKPAQAQACDPRLTCCDPEAASAAPAR
jgi:hypothetical protein